jgi:hypothetical protein
MKNNTSVKSKAIKSVNVELAPAATAAAAGSAVDKFVHTLSSEVVKTYNHAAAQMKAWEKVVKDNRPLVEDPALHCLYGHNSANPESAVKTVRVVDASGSVCNVTLADTYGKAGLDPEKVTTALRQLGKLDPNEFVAEKVVIGFDTSVFYDEKGNLRKALYEAVMVSLAATAELHGVPSPFSSHKVVTVKDGFAEKRWSAFTEEQQETVTDLFPAQVRLTPQAQEAK